MSKKKVVKAPPKKTIKKPVPKPAAETKKPETRMIATKQGLVEVEVKKEEKKKDTRKYIKVPENESVEKCKEIGERVFRKEIKFAYYASDGSMGYRYYVIL
jgi:hypothetical protein